MLMKARDIRMPRSCGRPIDEDISLVDYYGIHPQDLPSQFEPRDFPPRECRPVVRRRTPTEIQALIRTLAEWDRLFDD